MAAGVEVVECFALADDRATAALGVRGGFTVTLVTPTVLEAVADTSSPRGPVAVVEIPAEPPGTDRDVLVAEVNDPGNVGTLIRTAAAFDMDIVLPRGAADPWAPKVLRAGAGGHFRTSIRRELPSAVGRIATVPTGGADVRRLDTVLDPARRWAVLIGSEAHGLDAATVSSADVRVSIPMPGRIESLNAAVAGAIVAHELTGWRTAGASANPPSARTRDS